MSNQRTRGVQGVAHFEKSIGGVECVRAGDHLVHQVATARCGRTGVHTPHRSRRSHQHRMCRAGRSVRISFVQSVCRTGTNARGSAQARRYSRTAGTRHGYITIATIRVIANSYLPPYAAAGARKIGHEYTRSLQTNGGATLERPFATPPTQHTGRSAFCFCSCSTSRLIPRTFELHLIAIPFSVRAHDAPRAANCDSYAMRHLAAFALSSGDAASRARRCSARIALDAQHSAH